MDEATRQRLNAINRAFYATTAQDFDQTRGRAWRGWQRLPQFLRTPLSVLDVGCGNGRLGVFLAEALNGSIVYHGLDNNAALLQAAAHALAPLDKLQATLTQHDIIDKPLPATQADCVALFGVLHHIPGAAARRAFMHELAQRVRPGGILCFAAWCFYELPRFQERIVPWEEGLSVERHDYLLDWRRGERALRYCHYVDEAEHEALVAATGCREVLRYRADGANNALNRYSILRCAG